MKNLNKAISTTLIAAIMLSVTVTGCNGKSKGKNEVIAEDTPWYSANKFEVEDGIEDASFKSVDYVGAYEDQVIFRAQGMYNSDPDTEWDSQSFYDLKFDFIIKYDLDGNILDTYDIKQLFNDNSDSDAKLYIDDVSISGYEVSAYSTNYAKGSGMQKSRLVLDVRDGSVIAFEKEADAGGVTSGSLILTKYEGGYCAEIYQVFNVNTSYKIVITDPNGETTSYDLDEYLPGMELHFVNNIVYTGDGKFVFSADCGEFDMDAVVSKVTFSFFTIDTNKKTITEYTGDTSAFYRHFFFASYQEGIGPVSIDMDGIYKIDFEQGAKDKIFSFDWCNINRYDVEYLSIISYSEDRIILAGTVYRGSNYLENEDDFDTMVYILDRQETNPNVGKKVLVASTLGTYNYCLCDAVCTYNETNPDYYIRLDDSYSTYSQDYDPTVDDLNALLLDQEAALSYQLMVDLMAGEGPDMILDASYYDQLNSPDYLLDLTSYVETDGLFSNVIDAAKTSDGKLYHCPVTISINGIVVHKDDVPSDLKGFTFDEYADFVSAVCNGTDPMYMEKTEFFTTCLSAMSDEFVTDGKVDYNKDSFKQLAEYTKNSTMQAGYGEFRSIMSEPLGNAEFLYSCTLAMLLPRYEDDLSDVRIVGLPTSDGRGPQISMDSSVAISAQTSEAEACAAFISTLLSEDIQTEYGTYTDGMPIRISSYEASSATLLERYNTSVEKDLSNYTSEELVMYNSNTKILDESVIDDFEAMIASCEDTASLDPAIEKIVYEEIQAYFADQKSIDDVIELINNRVSLYVSERNG